MYVLIIEDNPDIVANLFGFLEPQGFTLDVAYTGTAGLELARNNHYDAIVLDLELPGIDGVEVCRQLRKDARRATPVLMLTARDTVKDKLTGFEVGADDYVVKPFSPREVAARVRAILKRMGPRADPATDAALFQLDTLRMQITYRGQPLTLTRHEFRLLQSLLEQPQRVFSREQLLDALGVASDAGYERTIDSHIKSLRAKLRQVAGDAEPIQTHRGLGYSYSPDHA